MPWVENTCGEPTGDGTPCERPAGWGTGRSIGPCKTHEADNRKLRKLDEDAEQTLIGAAQQGAKHEHCAMLAGVGARTLREWRQWAQEDIADGIENDLTDFYRRYQRARAAGALKNLKQSDPEFILERSYGYTKTETHEVGLDTDHDIDVEESVTADFVTFAPTDENENAADGEN